MTVRNNHNGGSSPLSSAGHATGHGTPSTNLTMMSPDAGYHASGTSYNNTEVVLRSQDQGPQASGSGMQYANNPYLPTRTHAVQGLSPTANAFQPVCAPTRRGRGDQPHLVHREPRLQARAGPARVEANANLTSFPRNQASALLLRSNNLYYGSFGTEDQSWRALKVSGLHLINNHELIHLMFSVTRFPSLRGIDAQESDRGIYKIAFNDSRDARQAFALAGMDLIGVAASVSWLEPRQLAASLGHEDVGSLTNHEGEIIISLISDHGDHSMTFGRFFQLVDSCGDVKAIHWFEDNNIRFVTFRVEFYHVFAADDFKSKYNGATIDNNHIQAFDYAPDVRPRGLTVATNVTASVTGRSVVAQADMDQLQRLMPRLMAPRNRIGHNQVNIQRIQSGQDVRTTIMLRNIPNKVTQEDLKRYLDQTSFGEYDFMYLRIDFANRCNVGYAFINFVDPLVITNFARVRSGQYWNVHESNKRAEISYATIQGCDCLIQKFRNSSVMLEDPSYRPKLFFVVPDRRAGRDKEFPEPDNFSKMRRSIENAEHIGLWIPSRGLTQPARIANAPHYAQPTRQAIAPAPQAAPDARRAHGQDLNRAVVVYHRPGATAAAHVPVPATHHARPANTNHPRLVLRAIDVNAPNDPFAGRGNSHSGTRPTRRFH